MGIGMVGRISEKKLVNSQSRKKGEIVHYRCLVCKIQSTGKIPRTLELACQSCGAHLLEEA